MCLCSHIWSYCSAFDYSDSFFWLHSALGWTRVKRGMTKAVDGKPYSKQKPRNFTMCERLLKAVFKWSQTKSRFWGNLCWSNCISTQRLLLVTLKADSRNRYLLSLAPGILALARSCTLFLSNQFSVWKTWNTIGCCTVAKNWTSWL